MGRGCTMDEWVHFEKLPEEGRVPNSSYWYVICRHCLRGYEQKQLPSFPSRLTGRRSSMRGHLKNCPIYGAQYKAEQQLLGASENSDTHNTQSATSTPTASTPTATATATAIAAAISGAEAAATSVDVGATAADAATTTATAAKAVATVPATDSVPLTLTPTANATTSSAAAVAALPVTSVDTTAPVVERRKRKSEGGRGKHCMMEEWEHFIRLQEEGYIGKSNFFQVICRHCQDAYDKAVAESKAVELAPPERLVGRREKMRKHLTLCPHFKGELPPLERRVTLNSAIIASLANHHNASRPSSSESVEPMGNADASGPLRVSESSRLALDEWQFFTRLHRKKDSAYHFARCNFCQMAYDRAPESLKKSMEPTIVMGRKSNMQTHLAKCPHIPKNAQLLTTTTTTTSGSVSTATPAASVSGVTAGFGSMAASSLTSSLENALSADKGKELLSATVGVKRDAPMGIGVNGKASKRLRTTISNGGPKELTNWQLALLSFTAHLKLSFDWLDQRPTRELFGQLLESEDAEHAGDGSSSLLASLLPDAATFRDSWLASLSDELDQKLLAKWKETVAPATASPLLTLLVACRNSVPKVNPVQCLLSYGSGLKLPNSKLMSSSCSNPEHVSTAQLVARSFADWVSADGVDPPRAVVLPLSVDFDEAKKLLKNVKTADDGERGRPILVLADFQQVLALLLHAILSFNTTKSTLQIFFGAFDAQKSKFDQLFPHRRLSSPRKSLRSCVDALQQVAEIKHVDLFEDHLHLNPKKHQTLWQNLRALNQVLGTLMQLVIAVEQGHWSAAQVLDGFGQLYEAAHLEEDADKTNGILKMFRELLEKAWARFEQPLHITAYLLDPRYRLHRVNREAVKKCFDLSEMSLKYYEIFSNESSLQLRTAVQSWEQQPLSADTPSSGELSVLTTQLEAIETSCGAVLSSTRALEKLLRHNDELSADQAQQVAYLMDCQVSHKGRGLVDEVVADTAEDVVDQWTKCVAQWMMSVGGDLEWLRRGHQQKKPNDMTTTTTTTKAQVVDEAEDTEGTDDGAEAEESKQSDEKLVAMAIDAAATSDKNTAMWGSELDALRNKKIRLEHLISRPLHQEVTI